MHIANPIYDAVFKFMMKDDYFLEIQEKERLIAQQDKAIKEQKKRIAELKRQQAQK